MSDELPPARETFFVPGTFTLASVRRFAGWLCAPTTENLSSRVGAWIVLCTGGLLLQGTVLQRYGVLVELEGLARILGAAFGFLLVAAVYLAWLEVTTLLQLAPKLFENVDGDPAQRHEPWSRQRPPSHDG